MEQSPSWEAKKFPASQEIHHISRKTIYNNPPSIPILSQINPAHHLTPNLFCKINFDIILPLTPAISQLPLSLRFPQQNYVHTICFLYTWYMSCPFNLVYLFSQIKLIFSRIKSVSGDNGADYYANVCPPPLPPLYLGPKYLPHHPGNVVPLEKMWTVSPLHHNISNAKWSE